MQSHSFQNLLTQSYQAFQRLMPMQLELHVSMPSRSRAPAISCIRITERLLCPKLRGSLAALGLLLASLVSLASLAPAQTLDFSQGFASNKLVLNGSAQLNDSRLRLTSLCDPQICSAQAGSAFYPDRVNIESFSTDFTFQLSDPGGTGFTFTIQEAGPQAVGLGSNQLGFYSAYSSDHPGVAVAFQFYFPRGSSTEKPINFFASGRGGYPNVFEDGSYSTNAINLRSGDVFAAHITYDGTFLVVTLTDTATNASTTQSTNLSGSLPNYLNATTAYVGFSAGTGGLNSTGQMLGSPSATQEILSWTFTPGPIVSVPAPTISPATGPQPTPPLVTITSPTPDASIHYTADNTDVSPKSPVYSTPFTPIGAKPIVHALAIAGGNISPVSVASYTVVNPVNFVAGFTPGSLALNGSAAIVGDRLRLTDGGGGETGSAWFPAPLPADTFGTDFDFQLTNAQADGFMFVLQNRGLDVLGYNGGSLGFPFLFPSNDVGIKFDLYDHNGEGINSTGVYTSGQSPTTPATDLTPAGLDLHSGHVFHVHITAGGGWIQMKITDTATGVSLSRDYFAHFSYSSNMYMGFTAGTGGLTAIQDILNWSVTPNPGPRILTPSLVPGGQTFPWSVPQQIGAIIQQDHLTPGPVTLFYTTDGSDPTVNSAVFPDSSSITISQTTTVKLIAIDTVHGISSPIDTEVYTFPKNFTPAPSLTTLVSFGPNPNGGVPPTAGLIADANGNLFGTTPAGGGSNLGTVFEVAKTATGYATTPTTLVSFSDIDGAQPYAGLIADANGNLFGTTQAGGGSDLGTVFEVPKTAAGYAPTPTTLVSFNGANGATPEAGLIVDANGNLLGTTHNGGGSGRGTVFEITKTATGYANIPTTLVSFDGSNGAEPAAGLIADANGNLLGTTADGGGSNAGTVFEVARTDTGYATNLTTLVSFNGSNGATPYSDLIVDANGNLFGTTQGGGGSSAGTVFELAKTATGYAATVSTLASFNHGNGDGPQGRLIADANGNLFGTTLSGGVFGFGTVFRVAKTATGYAATPTTLVSFSGSGSDGAIPEAGLIADANGNLFGTTFIGGASGAGTLFELVGSGFVPR